MTKPTRKEIFEEITAERDYQLERWGATADEQINRPADWVLYLAHYSSRWMNGSFAPYDVDTLADFRRHMVKAATIALAAIEETDKILAGENVRDDVLRPDQGL
jgi:hypothetical protein